MYSLETRCAVASPYQSPCLLSLSWGVVTVVAAIRRCRCQSLPVNSYLVEKRKVRKKTRARDRGVLMCPSK